jgi:uncharacterized repeat protein (TIGR03803 family)
MFRPFLNLRAALGLACVALMACAAVQSPSQTATNTVIDFGYGVGMLQAGDQNFYGISTSIEIPCVPNVGECDKIYQVTHAGEADIFYEFDEANNNLANTANSCQLTDLIVGADGSLYGTCIYGGLSGNGSIFKIPLNGSSPKVTTLVSFGTEPNGNPDDGYQPLALVQGNNGNIYFTNASGLYKLDSSGAVSDVYTFPYTPLTDLTINGYYPTSIMQASDGNFYLTLAVSPGAPPGYIPSSGIGEQPGAIVQISPSGDFQLIHSLAATGSEGDTPSGPLVEDSTGALYGMTASSYNNYNQTAAGVAFKVTPADGKLTILHSFTGGADGMVDTEAFVPVLILGSDGNLYGTTISGGDTTSTNCAPFGCGTVFQLTTSGALTTLHTFTGGVPAKNTTTPAQNPDVDGAGPRAPLVQTSDGSFYGIQTTAIQFPVVFQISLTDPLPAPIQITFDPATVAPGDTTNLSWSVLNAFSQTAQLCSASIVGNPAGADAADWNGLQSGSLVSGVYGGSADITPTAGGNFTYALTCGGQESGFGTLAVNNLSSLQIEPPSTAALQATVSQEYNLALTAFGGTVPYTWSITEGTLPPGLTFDEEHGSFDGTPQQFGKYSLVVQVEDSSKPNPLPPQTLSITFNVVSGLNLLNSLPNGVVGTSYPGSLAPLTTGGLSPYTWTITKGTLPAGLQLDQNTGAIMGTPTAQGTSSFTITVSDSEDTPATFQQSFNISIGGALELTTPSPLTPNAAVGEFYSVPLAASGGTPPYTFSFVTNAGTVPPGLTISSNGIISGTPTQYSNAPGGYNNFFVMVTDMSNPPLSSPFGLALQVQSTLQIVPPTQGDGMVGLPDGTVGVLTSVPLTATGGVPPYKWSVSSTPAANLGLTIVDGNVLQYFPAVAIYSMVTLTVSDSEQYPATNQLDVPLMTVPLGLPTTTTLTSSNAAAGTGESVTLTAKVTQSAGGIPAGQVTFSYATTTLGTAMLDANGNATLQTSFAATGVYNIIATYSGNGSYAPSVSNSLTETVVTPGVTASVNPTSLSIQPGSSGQLIITITPAGGYTGTIDFSCGTLPAHVSCTFAPPTLALNGAGPFTDTLTVSTNAAATAQLRIPGVGGRLDGGKLDSLLAAALLWLPGSAVAIFGLKRRKWKDSTPRQVLPRPVLWMIAILLWIGAGALSSCGGKSSFAAPGTYTIPITLTVSGEATQNINATVIVE